MANQGKVVDAAVKWWNNKVPYGSEDTGRFTFESHLKNPTVNCVTVSEKELALALVEYIAKEREEFEAKWKP